MRTSGSTHLNPPDFGADAAGLVLTIVRIRFVCPSGYSRKIATTQSGGWGAAPPTPPANFLYKVGSKTFRFLTANGQKSKCDHPSQKVSQPGKHLLAASAAKRNGVAKGEVPCFGGKQPEQLRFPHKYLNRVRMTGCRGCSLPGSQAQRPVTPRRNPACAIVWGGVSAPRTAPARSR